MFVEQLINGTTLGVVYALVALGYSMVYGVLRFVNFAHGDVCMVGAYVSLVMCSKFHVGLVPALIVSMAAAAVLGMVIEKFAYFPLRNASKVTTMMSALGMSLLLSTMGQILWGSITQPFPTVLKIQKWHVFGAHANSLQLIMFLVCVALFVVLQILVQKSTIGKALRATSQDREAALLMGINTDNVISFTFLVASAFAAVAGTFIGIYYDAVYPTMGGMLGTRAFTAAILGGIGNIPGTVLGGLILGIAEVLGAAYISTLWRDGIAFMIMILVLLVKPSGLLGRVQR